MSIIEGRAQTGAYATGHAVPASLRKQRGSAGCRGSVHFLSVHPQPQPMEQHHPHSEGSSYFISTFLETPALTQPVSCFHGDSKSSQVDRGDCCLIWKGGDGRPHFPVFYHNYNIILGVLVVATNTGWLHYPSFVFSHMAEMDHIQQ